MQVCMHLCMHSSLSKHTYIYAFVYKRSINTRTRYYVYTRAQTHAHYYADALHTFAQDFTHLVYTYA